MAIQIFKAEIEHVKWLQEIACQTFKETYAAYNTVEDMNAYLKEHFNETSLKCSLSDKQTLFYLAKDKDIIVGYIKTNFKPIPNDSLQGKGIELERIYVLKSYIGSGLGLLLLQKAIAVAAENQCDYLWLGVWEHNPRAINFYNKNGFQIIGEHQFLLGRDLQRDHLLFLPISN